MTQRPSEQAVTAWARLVRAESLLLGHVHQALKAAGLPPLVWYDVLLELHRSRDEGGLRQYQLGERMLLPKHNLSRLVDRLVRDGLVERLACLEDGRGNIVRITREGASLLKRMWPVYATVIHEQLESRLTPDEVSALAGILGKLVQPVATTGDDPVAGDRGDNLPSPRSGLPDR